MEAKKMFLDNPHRDEGREAWWVHNRLQKKKEEEAPFEFVKGNCSWTLKNTFQKYIIKVKKQIHRKQVGALENTSISCCEIDNRQCGCWAIDSF